MTSSMIFYAGVWVSAAALAGLFAGLMILKVRGLKLKMKLDEEYGKEEKEHRGS